MRHLIAIQYICFSECLHCVELVLGVQLSHQGHFAERTNPDNLDLGEHGFIHFRSFETNVIRFFLGQHFPHLTLSLSTQTNFRHFRFQLESSVQPLFMGLENVFDVLLHEEFEGLGRVVSDFAVSSLLLLLLAHVLSLGYWGLVFDLVGSFGATVVGRGRMIAGVSVCN